MSAVAVPPELTPDALSAFHDEITHAVSKAPCVVLRGSADVFCNGLSLSCAGAEADLWPAFKTFAATLHALYAAPVPVIVAVEGPAIGGGVGIAAAATLVAVTEGAAFTLTEPLLGLTPAMIAPILCERMAPAAVRAMASDARPRTPQMAHTIGLADHIVPAANLTGWLKGTARTIARADRDALHASLNLTRRADMASALQTAARATHDRLLTEAAQHRIAALCEGDVPWR